MEKDRLTIRRARITAVVLGALASLTIIAFVYAFKQQAEAKRQFSLTQNAQRQLEVCSQDLAEYHHRVEDLTRQLQQVSEK